MRERERERASVQMDFSTRINHCRHRNGPTAVMDGRIFLVDVFSVADNLEVQAFPLFSTCVWLNIFNC